MPVPFQRASPPARPETAFALWFPFREDKIVVQAQESGLALIAGEQAAIAVLEPRAPLYLGTLNGIPCLACEVDAGEKAIPDNWRVLDLRRTFGLLDKDASLIAGYAAQILRWQRGHRYCPNCGLPLGELSEQWSRHCAGCGYIGYPPVTPAILVLVYDGPCVLLARKAGWGTRYSIIAGFVEPGETLEECAQREVAEEVGVEITDVTYIGGQPWPFPNQLMIGFTARYVSGEIQPDQVEIEHAAWFRFDQLPELPSSISLSHQLIMQWVEEQKSGQAG